MNFKNILVILSLFLSQQFSYAQQSANGFNQKMNLMLYQQLPESIQKNKKLIAVDDGTSPPHIIHTEDLKLNGASIDLIDAVGEILGVSIVHEEVSGISSMLIGLTSDRYDIAIGPLADTLAREKEYDFIDHIKEFTAVLVAKGNPLNIETFDDLCGKRVASQSGDLAERRLKEQSDACVAAGKKAIEVSTFKDQSTALLALKADRVDAMRVAGAIGGYFVAHSSDDIEKVDIGLKDDSPYPPNYQGWLVKKDSPLGKVILAAMQELQANGTYSQIMHKWGLDSNQVDKIGFNLAEY